MHVTPQSIELTFIDPDADVSEPYQGIGLCYGDDGVVVDLGFVGA